jgi:hypothetical protein
MNPNMEANMAMQSALAVAPATARTSLPALVDRAVQALASARTSAEVLEARDLATLAYDAAKRAARLSKEKNAHDSLIAAAHRAQADALEIEAQAKRKLADEYDAAQERGEVAKQSDSLKRGPVVPNDNNGKVHVSDIGLSRKVIHEAREIRDAEQADPGIVRRTLDEAIEAGEEPTRAKVKRAVKAKSKRKRHPKPNFTAPNESQHDRDLRMLLGVWESACESARGAFLEIVVQ